MDIGRPLITFRKICHVELKYTLAVCDNLNNNTAAEQDVQQQVINFQVLISLKLDRLKSKKIVCKKA